MNNRQTTASHLARSLNEALVLKYGKVPTATAFADQFNLRAYGTSTITRETARRWLLGLTVPEIDKLIVLVDWLKLDVSTLFKREKQSTLLRKNLYTQPKKEHIDHHIDNCIKRLNTSSKNALLLAALMLKALQDSDYSREVCDQLINAQLLYCPKCRNKLLKNS